MFKLEKFTKFPAGQIVKYKLKKGKNCIRGNWMKKEIRYYHGSLHFLQLV